MSTPTVPEETESAADDKVEVFGLAVTAAQRMDYLRRYLDADSTPIQRPHMEPDPDQKAGR